MKRVITVASIVIGVILITWLIVCEAKDFPLYRLSFSEISQLKLEQGTNLGNFTEYYAMINDVCMKVFEAYNLSEGNEKKFASELEIHIEPTFKIHKHNLVTLLTNINTVAEKCLNKMERHSWVASQANMIYNNLENAWEDSHDDVYRTEIYTYTTTDSKGNTTIHTDTRQVYDHTDHEYIFKKQYALNGLAQLKEMRNKFSALIKPEIIQSPKVTQAEGEYATEKTFKFYNEKIKYDDVTNIILSWSKRTVCNKYIDSIITVYDNILETIDIYEMFIEQSKSVSYSTHSHYDDGPKAFQMNERMKDMNANIYNLINAILSPIVTVRMNSEQYLKDIQQYIDDVQSSKKSKIKNNYITEISEKWYTYNFSDGFQLKERRTLWLTIMFIVLIIGVVAIINVVIRKNEME